MLRLWITTFRTQFWWGWKRSVLSRRAWIPLVGCLPLWAMQVVVLTRRGNPHFLEKFFLYFQSWAYLSILLPLVSLYLAVSALQDDRDGGSLVYIVSRPAPRPAVPLGRAAGAGLASLVFGGIYLAVSLSVFSLAGPSLGGGSLLPPGAPGAFFLATLVGGLCFTALGTFFGAFFKKGLLLGMALVVGWELAAGSFLSQAQVTGLRSLLATDLSRQVVLLSLPETWREVVSEGLTLPEGAHMYGVLRGAGEYIAIFLLLGVMAFCLKEHPYRARER